MPYRPPFRRPDKRGTRPILPFAATISVVALATACGPGELAANTRATKVSANVSRIPPEWKPFDDLTGRCGTGELTPIGETQIDREPYVQQVEATRAKLLFTSRSDAPITVDLRQPDTDETVTAVSTIEPTRHLRGLFQHVVDISELEPDTMYCYSLRNGSEPLTQPIGFETAPETGAADTTISFAVFGDSGEASSGQFAVLDQLEKVPLDLVLVAGDVAYDSGTLGQLESKFFDVYGPVLRSVPFYPVAGNHDYRTDDGGPLREVFSLPEVRDPAGTERWYSFDHGNVHFVGLDTQLPSEMQVEWLIADLASTSQPLTVVLMHKGPYSSGEHGSNMEVRERLCPIFEEYGVDLVFSGHDHDYERSQHINGVTYVVTGGGGRSSDPTSFSDFSAFSESVLHFVHVTVRGDTVTLRAIDGTGQLFDGVVLELGDVAQRHDMVGHDDMVNDAMINQGS